MADTDQNEKSIVVAIDKNNLVRLVNASGAEALKLQDNIGFAKVNSSSKEFDPKEFDEVVKKVGSPEKAREMIKSVQDAITQFSSRDGKKEFLAKLGVTADTPDSYRLVAYIDPAQTVLFKETLQGDKIIANESYVPPKEFQGLSRISGMGLAAGSSDEGLVKIAELFTDVMKNSFKKLPKPIEIPTQKSEKDKLGPSDDIEIQTIKFTPDQRKKLEEQVTLLALADKAPMRGNVVLSDLATSAGSHAAMPFNASINEGVTPT